MRGARSIPGIGQKSTSPTNFPGPFPECFSAIYAFAPFKKRVK